MEPRKKLHMNGISSEDLILANITCVKLVQPYLRLCVFLSRARKEFRDFHDRFWLGESRTFFSELAAVLDMLTRALDLGQPKCRRGPLEKVA